jgi:hypothetical protein
MHAGFQIGSLCAAARQNGATGDAGTNRERKPNSHLPRDYLPAFTPALDL